MISKKVKALEWNEENIEKFWNHHSQNPQKYFTSLYGKNIIKFVSKYINKKSSVLDYACGTGGLTKRLLEAGFFVSCTDMSARSRTIIHKMFNSHSAFKGVFSSDSFNEINFKVDVVILVEIVEHVSDNDLDQIFSNITQVLLSGGKIIITTPNDENLDHETVFCPCCENTFHRWQHVRSWNRDSLSKFILKKGFHNLVVKEVDFALSKDLGIFRYYLLSIYTRLFSRKKPNLCIVAEKK